MARVSTAVTILGQEYRIKSESEPDSVRRAARYVDETMERIRDRTGTVDSLDVAVLTALNMANQLIGARDATASLAPDSLRELIDRVEAALDPPESA